MTPSQLGNVELLESADLPARTLIAPLSLFREIRLSLGATNINLRVGTQEAVLVSSDLFEAYTAWDEQRTDIDPLCN